MFGTRQWHLRTWLIWLLCVSSEVSFVVIGALLFLVRVPQISDETRQTLTQLYPDAVFISAIHRPSLASLVERIKSLL